MKNGILKTFSVLLIIGFVLGGVGFTTALPVYAISHSDLVELFVDLEIIPVEYVDEARQVVVSPDYTTLDLFECVELLIVNGIIPVNKASEARDVVAGANSNYGTEQLPFPNGLYAEVVKKEAIILQDSEGERGKYTIKFDLTAVGDTFYLSTNPQESLRYFIEGGIYGALAPSVDLQEVSFYGTANIDDGMFVIGEGGTETFTLENVFTPVASGEYTFELGYVDYTDVATGKNLYYMEATPREEFRTAPLNLHVTTTQVLPWQKVCGKFENKNKKARQHMSNRCEMLFQKKRR